MFIHYRCTFYFFGEVKTTCNHDVTILAHRYVEIVSDLDNTLIVTVFDIIQFQFVTIL